MIQVNTLVRHPKHKGIGCVSKLHGKKVAVNFGLLRSYKVNPAELMEVDVSQSPTVALSMYQSRIMMEKSNLNDVILGNEVRHYVGIGWITQRVCTEEDLKKIPRVVY